MSGRAGKPSAPRVLLYSSQGCAHCRRAKAFLNARGIAYSELDVGRSPKARRALERLGARGVPTILIGDQRLDGFSERAFLALYQRQRQA
jgi:glutaredoxin